MRNPRALSQRRGWSLSPIPRRERRRSPCLIGKCLPASRSRMKPRIQRERRRCNQRFRPIRCGAASRRRSKAAKLWLGRRNRREDRELGAPGAGHKTWCLLCDDGLVRGSERGRTAVKERLCEEKGRSGVKDGYRSAIRTEEAMPISPIGPTVQNLEICSSCAFLKPRDILSRKIEQRGDQKPPPSARLIMSAKPPRRRRNQPPSSSGGL
jgi:hypothetical protein